MHRNHSSRRPSHQGNPAAEQRSLFSKGTGQRPAPAQELPLPGWVAMVAATARETLGHDFPPAHIFRDLQPVARVYGVERLLSGWRDCCEGEPVRVRVTPHHFANAAAWWCKWRLAALDPDLIFRPVPYNEREIDQLRFSGKAATVQRSWTARAMGIWGYYIGIVSPGHIAKVLAPIVQAHGADLTLRALDLFCSTEPYRRRDGSLPKWNGNEPTPVWNPRAMTPERFAANVGYWLEQEKTPCP